MVLVGIGVGVSSGVGAGGDRGDRSPPVYNPGGIIPPTFQAKLRVKNTLHGR